MNYKKMKVEELLEVIAERGLETKDGMLKADLVKMLEDDDQPIEVEAEPIDDEMIPSAAFALDMSGIQADIASLTEAIDGALTALGDYGATDEVIGGMDGNDAKLCEQGLSAAIKLADDARKKLNRDYKVPLDQAKRRYDELMAPVLELHGKYRERRVEADEERKSLRRQGLENSYVEFCAANGFESLPQVVAFQRLLDANPKWMNKTTNAAKAAEEVESIALRIANDWGTLAKQRSTLPFYEEAEAEFFRTLDVGAALAYSAKRAEEQQRIDALKAEREGARAYVEQARFEEVASEAQGYEAAWTVGLAPEQTPEPSAKARQPEEAAKAEPAVGYDMRKPWLLEIDLSDAEKLKLKNWLIENNVGANRKFYANPRKEVA